MVVCVKSPTLPRYTWVVGFISLEQTSSLKVGLPSRCTRVWTIVPHVRGRVKSPTLPRYTWVVGFISLEQTSSLKVPFVEE
jgi:hypothetical protein